MTFTTNVSTLKQKLGVPEGEYEVLDTSNIPEALQDDERMDDNDPMIDSVDLGNGKEYVVADKKSPDKRIQHRKTLRRHKWNPIQKFTKKSGA